MPAVSGAWCFCLRDLPSSLARTLKSEERALSGGEGLPVPQLFGCFAGGDGPEVLVLVLVLVGDSPLFRVGAGPLNLVRLVPPCCWRLELD